MTHHAFPGLRADSLLTYLAALGLTRVVSEADPELRTWWGGDHLHMETDVEDVPELLVHDYRPTPVFSPWNGGSGFGANDRNQRAAIDTLISSDAPRLSIFVDGYRAVLGVIARRDESSTAWTKERFAVELRNRVPLEGLRWLDAVIVVGGDRLHFPGIYGTGGNDGRLEFSAKFHERLAEVLPEISGKPELSRSWASDALTGASTTPLRRAPVGQADPVGGRSPGTWALGSGPSLVNPWLYALMIEASGYLAASLVRAGQGDPRAAVPFSVDASASGDTAGSDTEKNRGEFWAPLWSTPMQHRELRQLFEQAKASWAGHVSTTSAAMYAAAKSGGVDGRLSAFYRYALTERNGLAHLAVPRARVTVRPRLGIEMAIPIERRARPFKTLTPRVANEQWRRIEKAQMAFVMPDEERVAAARLVDWLAALTARERSAAISARERDRIISAAPAPRAIDAVTELRGWMQERAEHRIAASLASGYVYESGDTRKRTPLRDLLMGRPPGRGEAVWREPVVQGYGTRALDDVLADLAVWRDQHAEGGVRGAGRGIRFISGHRYRCRRDDVTRWVRGDLNERDLEHALEACLSLDWEGWARASMAREFDIPDPMFAVLAAVASGQIIRPGFATDDPDAQARQAFPPGWALRLRAGRVRDVIDEATALLNRSRIEPRRAVPQRPGADSAESWSAEAKQRRHPERHFTVIAPMAPASDSKLGTRLAAALLTPVSVNYLSRLDSLAAPRARTSGDDPSNTQSLDEGEPA